MNKSAISLSINFLVVIIISLVVLGFGITLLFKFMGGAEDIKGKLDQRTQEQIEHLLIDEGKKVALPLHHANLYGGGEKAFGVGIRNIDFLQFGDKFRINIEANTPSDTNANEWFLYFKEDLTIEENEHHVEPIMVSVPDNAAKGLYIFDVTVFDSFNKPYGNKQKLTVNVK